MKLKQSFLPVSIFLAAITLPFIFAAFSGGEQSVFGGFLLNPMDGNSYLAKMQLGFQGEWLFHLPYTIEQGEGAYLFLFYIFLGKIASFFGLPLILTFHAARVIASCFLFFTLFKFIKETFPGLNAGWQESALALAVFGSGLGWIAIVLGKQTSDLWVAEGYPFLASYINPHFPLGMGLILWIFLISHRTAVRPKILILPLGLCLAIILPFGVVISGTVLVIQSAWTFIESRRLDWQGVVFLGIGGGFFLFYQYAVILADPVLAAWNSQNQTPAPDILDFLISVSPAFFFALAGGYSIWREKQTGLGRILLIWLVAGILLTYLPINIQRRFFTGYYIPAALLAIPGIRTVGIKFLSRPSLFRLVLISSLPTLILVVGLFGIFGIATRNPAYYLNRSEVEGFVWLQNHLEPGSVVVTDPETGLYIPAFTSMKVIYGHPFETIRASEQKLAVEKFFSGGMSPEESNTWLRQSGAAAIFVGPRLKPDPSFSMLNNWLPAYQSGNVEIYADR